MIERAQHEIQLLCEEYANLELQTERAIRAGSFRKLALLYNLQKKWIERAMPFLELKINDAYTHEV